MLHSFNPGTGKLLAEFTADSPEAVQLKIKKAQNAYIGWSQKSVQERCKILLPAVQWMKEHEDEIIKIVVEEEGKNYIEAYALDYWSVQYLISYWCKYAPKTLKSEKIPMSSAMKLDGRSSRIHFLPSGITAIISPWNNPIGIPAGQVALALIAGNAVILKPSSSTPLCGLKIQEIFQKGTKMDPNLLLIILGSGHDVGPLLCSPPITRVMFTGSVKTGSIISQLCSEHFIPCELELGGKDPMIIREDADIKRAAAGAVWGGFINSGQTCCSIRRIFVHEKVYEGFVKEITRITLQLIQGNMSHCKENGLPIEHADIGPMINSMEGSHVAEVITEAVENGAKILVGGKRNKNPKNLIQNADSEKTYYYFPTILTNVDIYSRIAQEELFGPVIILWKVKNDYEAIVLANKCSLGLSASIWTKNIIKGEMLAKMVQAGTICINSHAYTYGLPQTPWGGLKDSGFGRTHSQYGLKWLCDMIHVHTNRGRLVKNEPYWYPLNEEHLKKFKFLSKLF